MFDIFHYTNYRTYLQDYYHHMKSSCEKYSLAEFSKKAGFRSRSFIHKLIRGDKAVPKSSIYKIAAAMELGKKETEYFQNLVFFNESKTLDEKNFYFEQMNIAHRTHNATILRQTQYKYFYNWYNTVIREIVAYTDFKEDYNALGRMICPAISAIKAKESVALLLELGLITKKDGKYVQTAKTISTGEEVRSLAVLNYQRDNLRLAMQAVSSIPRDIRDVSTLTLSTNKEGFEAIKTEIRNLRKKVASMVELHEPVDRVYQLNIQLFPLTRI